MTWIPFASWLANRSLASLIQIREVSGEFPRAAYNTLFRQQLDRLGQDDQFQNFDWVGYIARSLRNAGFGDHDIDPLTHELVVRLLVQPGTLFRGWKGQPIDRRFKVAVRNAILNVVEKRRARAQRIPVMAMPAEPLSANRADDDALIDQFRAFLRKMHGEAAVEVFDQRFSGVDTKSLLGQPGLETGYRLKQVVQAIKQAAIDFAADDPQFQAMIMKAMEEERKTVAKRFD